MYRKYHESFGNDSDYVEHGSDTERHVKGSVIHWKPFNHNSKVDLPLMRDIL